MPVPDAFIFVAPHPGQGQLLLNCIDPSVMDELDPFSKDPDLFPFSRGNGFRPPPESSCYDAAFVTRYRLGQRARVARIDAKARELVASRQAARRRAKASGRIEDEMQGACNAIFQVWRTDADLRAFDLALDPSDRRWGTVWGSQPTASNLGAVGFARVCTPESWLSTWSATSSNAAFARCAPAIRQPSLMVYYTGDNTVFPTDALRLFESIGSADKSRIDVRGDHHGHALSPNEPISPQQVSGNAICAWLKERFPTRRA